MRSSLNGAGVGGERVGGGMSSPLGGTIGCGSGNSTALLELEPEPEFGPGLRALGSALDEFEDEDEAGADVACLRMETGLNGLAVGPIAALRLDPALDSADRPDFWLAASGTKPCANRSKEL
jgi:hypothetical protein